MRTRVRAIASVETPTQSQDLLLLEVPAVLLVHKDEVQEVPHGELVLHVRVRGCQLEACQVQPHRDALVLVYVQARDG